MRRHATLYPFLFCLFLTGSLFAQDIHWSQFSQSPLNLNPALTGVFGGDLRIMGNYRSQWSNVPVKYRTASIGADKVFLLSRESTTRIGGGVVLNYDVAGDSKLNNLNLGLSLAPTMQLSPKHFATLGIQAGFIQRSFQTEDLEFGDQFIDGQFQTNSTSAETFPNTSRLSFDFGAGFNYHFQDRQPDFALLSPEAVKRTRFDAGFGISHINRPNVDFIEFDDQDDDIAELDNKFTAYLMGVIQLDTSIDLVPRALWQVQGKYDQVVLQLAARIHLSHDFGNQLALDLGMGYRFFNNVDSWFPHITAHYRNWQVGFNYDVNISDFSVATRNYGGFEISVIYIVTKIQPPNVKICPIF